MALLTIDDKYLTGIGLFDDNNHILADKLNILESKFRKNDQDEIFTFFKNFAEEYNSIVKLYMVYMESNHYSEIDFFKLIHRHHLNFLSKVGQGLLSGKRLMNEEILLHLKEIVTNTIGCNRGCARQIQSTKVRVNSLVSKVTS